MPVKISRLQKWNSLENKHLDLRKILEQILVFYILRRVFSDFSSYGFDFQLPFPQESVKKTSLKLNLIKEAVRNKKQYRSFLNFIRSLEKAKENPKLPFFFKPSFSFCKSPANNIFQSFDRILRKSIFGFDSIKRTNENYKITFLNNGYYFISTMYGNFHVLTHKNLIPTSDFPVYFLKIPTFFNLIFKFMYRVFCFFGFKVPAHGPRKWFQLKPPVSAHSKMPKGGYDVNQVINTSSKLNFKIFINFFRIIRVARSKENLLDFYFSNILPV